VTDGAPRWHSSNLVGVAAPVLASAAFNARPQALHIAGTREQHTGLFALLARCGGAGEAQAVFAQYMTMAFGLLPPPQSTTGPRHWRSSYLRLLQGWGQDANGAAGAVLKGWAESRFGIAPVFHKAPLQRFPSPAWMGYLEEKAASRYHNNDILRQLDLLYEFCQWMLQHFLLPAGTTHLPLWRGSTRCEEQLVAGSLRERRGTVRLNNLVSFSHSRDDADCFGDWLMSASVPCCKLLVVPGLLATTALRGEAEVLAIGGDYAVELSYV
jgi:NAD+--dinitrogen-reductase ADP-D-ribosyltransferase